MFVYAVIGEALADLGILNTTLDPLPVAGIVNVLLQLLGIVPQAVFFVSPIRHHLPRPLVGHHEGKDCDADQIHPQYPLKT